MLLRAMLFRRKPQAVPCWQVLTLVSPACFSGKKSMSKLGVHSQHGAQLQRGRMLWV